MYSLNMKKFLMNTKEDEEIEEMTKKKSTRHVQRCEVVWLGHTTVREQSELKPGKVSWGQTAGTLQ